jgi:hypothetical protein
VQVYPSHEASPIEQNSSETRTYEQAHGCSAFAQQDKHERLSMSAPAVAITSARRTIAPVWHTLLYLVALGCFSAFGSRIAGLARFGLPPRMWSYAFIIASEWLLLAVVVWGLRVGRTSIISVVGERWSSARTFFRDLGLAIVFMVSSNVVLAVVTQLLHATQSARVLRLLPTTRGEMAVWVIVCDQCRDL